MTMFQNLHRVMRPFDVLRARCACGREASWSQAEAFRLFGPDAAPFEIRRRLRCTSCGRLDAVQVWI